MTPGACEPSVCDDWADLGLPGITSVDSCYSVSFSGTTTAQPEEISRLLESKGYVAGYPLSGQDYDKSKTWLVYRKEGEASALKLPSKLNKQGDGFLLVMERVPDPGERGWVSLEEYKALKDVWQRTAAMAERFSFLQDGFDSKEAPGRCPASALEGQAWVNATLAPIIIRKVAGESKYRLVSWLQTNGVDRSDTIGARRAQAAALARYDGATSIPVVRKGTTTGLRRTGKKTFEGGMSSVTVAVVDIASKRVLCSTRALATSSSTVTVRDGTADTDLAMDMSRNERKAYVRAFAKLSPLLAPR